MQRRAKWLTIPSFYTVTGIEPSKIKHYIQTKQIEKDDEYKIVNGFVFVRSHNNVVEKIRSLDAVETG